MKKERNWFIVFLLFGITSLVLNQTWFVPDEYWQSLEIAHSIVFKYGYETWEWQKGIRSAAYPLMISILYWILSLLYLDNIKLLIHLPRLAQVILSSVSYLCTCKLSAFLHGKDAFRWTALCIMSSWMMFYSMNRTLYNATESALTMIGLSLFPWKRKAFSYDSNWPFVSVVALTTVLRPTALIIWFPVIIYHFILYRSEGNLVKILKLYLLIGVLAIIIQLALDFIFYKRFLFTTYNFLKFNFIHNLSIHYGIHPWHWYLTQGIPQLFATHLPLFIFVAWRKPLHPMMLLSYWIIAIYSNLDHKEFRFLLPVVPMGLCTLGGYLSHISKRKATMIMVFIFLSNIPLSFYFGLFHQRGSLDVVSYIAHESHRNPSMKVLFLMPCHSTPYYSHIHNNISLEFLTCEPNLNNKPNYVDEADRFFKDPLEWLDQKYNLQVSGVNVPSRKKDVLKSNSFPNHIVLFDSLEYNVRSFLDDYNFSLCKQFFHTHFPEGRTGRTIQVWCR